MTRRRRSWQKGGDEREARGRPIGRSPRSGSERGNCHRSLPRAFLGGVGIVDVVTRSRRTKVAGPLAGSTCAATASGQPLPGGQPVGMPIGVWRRRRRSS